MKRPSFQFYPGDWLSDPNLRRCSPAARGTWIDLLCVLHDCEEYGVCRWPLADLANAAGAKIQWVRELIAKGVLKGADRGAAPLVHTPRHAGQSYPPVTLLEAGDGPCWYCSRLVRDEWLRARRGASTRFDSSNQPAKRGSPTTTGTLLDSSPNPSPNSSPIPSPNRRVGERQGDGSSASASSSTSERAKAKKTASTPSHADDPHPKDGARRPARISDGNSRATSYQPPDWVPGEPWAAFVEMRRKIRAPLTDRAAQMIVAKLETLKAQGHEPAALLEQSVRSSWRDVYEPRASFSAPPQAGKRRLSISTPLPNEYGPNDIPDWMNAAGPDKQEQTQ